MFPIIIPYVSKVREHKFYIMLKAREQIDAVLKYFYDKKDEVTLTILDDFKSNIELLKIAGNEPELTRMILKLKNDKFIQIYPDYPRFPDGKQDMSKGLLTICTITFDGRLFWEDGGYTKESEVNEAAEKTKNSREKYLSRGTVWLAFLTGGLVLIEILIHWSELKHLLSCH